MSEWRDLPSMTSVRSDGAKIGAFPGPGDRMEWWGYPPGYRPGSWDGPEPQGPFNSPDEAKAAMGTLLDFGE